ncbi:uncharacterized protein LOC135144527 [Zophobas morio]|uniref:uncharacterized protein LOC135144527 n=1 Tax=Zophobas morio TaxID=2755281 RepID=UPI003083CA1E
MNKNIIGWSLLGTQLYKLLLFCQRKTGNNLNFIESCCLILSNESCGFLQRTEALDHLLDISKSQSKEVVLQSQCFLESKVSSVEHIELGASVTLKLTVLSHAPLDIIVDRVILFIEKDDSRPVETNMNPSNLFKNLLESNTNITIQNAKVILIILYL